MTHAPDNFAIGLDIGGTETKAVVVDRKGNVVARGSEPTALPSRKEKADVITRLRDHVDRLRAGVGAPVQYLGVAIPGMASRDERSVQWLPKDKLSLQGVNFTDALQWPKTVSVLNDAHAALLGEAWCGGAMNKRDVVMLTLGTGVGGAFMCDGRLVRGAMGRAGHLGHIGIGSDSPPSVCDMPGSLEESIGDVSITRRSNGRFRKTRDLIDAVKSEDVDAARIWDQSVKDLAYAIASFINMLDPEIIVVSGGIAKAGDALFVPLKKHLSLIEWKPTGSGVSIVPSQLGEWAGAIGAASRAFGINA